MKRLSGGLLEAWPSTQDVVSADVESTCHLHSEIEVALQGLSGHIQLTDTLANRMLLKMGSSPPDPGLQLLSKGQMRACRSFLQGDVSWCCVERPPRTRAPGLTCVGPHHSLLCHNWLFTALQLLSLSPAASAVVACLGGCLSQMRRAWWCAGVHRCARVHVQVCTQVCAGMLGARHFSLSYPRLLRPEV